MEKAPKGFSPGRGRMLPGGGSWGVAGLPECCRPVPGIGHPEPAVALVCDLDGAGLPECCMPAPGISHTEPAVAPVCKVSADSRQKGRRPAPKTPQTGAKNAANLRHESRQRASPPPRFQKNGHLCILPRNVARIMAVMAIFVAAFPWNRHSVRSGKKRGKTHLDRGTEGQPGGPRHRKKTLTL